MLMQPREDADDNRMILSTLTCLVWDINTLTRLVRDIMIVTLGTVARSFVELHPRRKSFSFTEDTPMGSRCR